MAKATRIPEPSVEDTRGVRLDLTYAEAVTLACLCGITGGDPVKSPRKHTDSVLSALKETGIDYVDKPVKGLRAPGGIMFRDGSAV